MGFIRAATAIVVLFGSLVAAQTVNDNAQCSPSNLCPESTPCCSQYGQCGIGAYCLGGCDPMSSHSLDSCMPAPVCSSSDFKFDSGTTAGIASDVSYLGNATADAWVASGTPKAFSDGGTDVVLLTLPQGGAGTLLASTAYVWYGKISATLKTSRTQGVVTAFILLSDVKDEIDFEFVGYNTSQAQSNFYWQGVNNFTNGRNHSVDDTFDDYHTYEIDWTPDSLTWSIDNNVVRTVKASDTVNGTTNSLGFPQTPARVQLSLWPAGSPSNANGTVAWAGGLIDWNSPDVHTAGYFYAMVKEVSVQCYDPPPGASTPGHEAYVYTNTAGLNDSVSLVDKNTVLKSLLGTGLDPDVAAPSNSPAPTNVVPGADSGSGSLGGNNANQGGSGSGGSPAGSAPSPTGSTFFGFAQNGGGTNGGAAARGDERALQGSLLGVVIVIAALIAI